MPSSLYLSCIFRAQVITLCPILFMDRVGAVVRVLVDLLGESWPEIFGFGALRANFGHPEGTLQ